MWDRCVNPDDLEDAREGRIYHETGWFSTLLIPNLSDASIKLSRTAIERSEEKRQEFAHRIGTYDACQLVFVDESAVDRRTTYRGKAWAIRGRKASRKTFFCRGQR